MTLGCRLPPPGMAGLLSMIQVNAVGCWVWQGRVDRTGRGAGYGRVGRDERAHLIVYTLLEGPIGRGYELDHVCDNRACVNPDHLDPVSRWENEQRKADKRARRRQADKRARRRRP